MRLLLADENLVVAGRTFVGFPLLLNENGQALEPAQTFLWYLLTNSGRIESKATWREYGRALYDFFGFICRNEIDWTSTSNGGSVGAIAAYREWSKGVLCLSDRTINQRLRIVVRFYLWAQREGHISNIPFDYVFVRNGGAPRMLVHLDSGNRRTSPNILLREKRTNIKFLTLSQVGICRDLVSNETHRLMFELMIRTGLRQIECRTFPEKYLFDPSRRADLLEGEKIRLLLDPRDMKLKGNKPRSIDVPYDLMADLWWYSARHRQRRERNQNGEKIWPVLFLTESGIPYGDSALTQIFRSLSQRVGFFVRPHMLRHTYATFLLWSLKMSTDFRGEALLYVRDRLGHSNVSTTEIYLHLINSLEGHLVLAHEDELDSLFSNRGSFDEKAERF